MPYPLPFPDDDDQAETEALARAVAEAEADSRRISHGEARAWLLKLAAGDFDAPPPEPRCAVTVIWSPPLSYQPAQSFTRAPLTK